MNSIWLRTSLLLTLFAILSVVVWLLKGPVVALAMFATLAVALLFFHLRNIAKFRQWLREPSVATVPDGIGVWRPLFSSLYRYLRVSTTTQQELSARLQRFSEAVQAIPDGVVILDKQNHIVWLNPTAEQHFGLRMQVDVGQVITNLVRQPDFVDYLEANDYNSPFTLRSSRLPSLTLSVRFIHYQQDQKLLLSRDISQWEKVETMRRDFVANVSHELKTPLTVIAGFLETLAETNLDQDTQRYVALMQEQTNRIRRLVEDLLALSQLESTNNTLVDEWLDLESLLQEVRKEALALSNGKHQISLHLDQPQKLLGNRQELASAFNNLASNAVRYTPAGGAIELRWFVRDGVGIFSVRDSGIGIEARHIPRLTERFYRVDQGRSRESGGTGLGLAIVKHVLARHQATLEVESEVGKGSSFSACFPENRLKPVKGEE